MVWVAAIGRGRPIGTRHMVTDLRPFYPHITLVAVGLSVRVPVDVPEDMDGRVLQVCEQPDEPAAGHDRVVIEQHQQVARGE